MILVMSGTADGREIVRELHQKGVRLVTTVTTAYGKALYREMGLGHLCVEEKLDGEGLSRFIEEKGIDTIIDATHPYAQRASLNAMEVSKAKGVKYIRFQREPTPIPSSPLVHKVKDLPEAVETSSKLGKRILLTTGFNSVQSFIHKLNRQKTEEEEEGFDPVRIWLTQAEFEKLSIAERNQLALDKRLKDKIDLVVRILPIPEHIEKCLAMGIPAWNIIALQGPFSKEFNIATFREFRIEVVVTKDGGKEAKTLEKVEACLEEGIPIVIIQRPELNYPVMYSSIDKLLVELNL